MRSTLLAALLVGVTVALMAWACAIAPAPVAPPDRLALATTVSLGGHCHAVAIAPGRLLTASHCVVPAMRVGGVAAYLESFEPLRDLALLRAALDFPIVRVRLPRFGERVQVVHLMCPAPPCVGEGRVEYVSAMWLEAALDWPCDRGMSGSGVWGTDGALVGIVKSLGTTTGRTYFATLPVQH